jgi:hypothetical protein
MSPRPAGQFMSAMPPAAARKRTSTEVGVGPKRNELQPITAFAEEQLLNEYDLNFSINGFDLGHELFLMNIATLPNSAGRIFTSRDASGNGFVLPTACNEFVYRWILHSRRWLRARKSLLRVGDGYF